MNNYDYDIVMLFMI